MTGEEQANSSRVSLIVIIGVLFLLLSILCLLPDSQNYTSFEIRSGPSYTLSQFNNRANGGNDTESPVADAGPDMNVSQNIPFLFDGSGSTDNIGIDNYTWKFDDIGNKELYGVGPSYVFSYVGHYYVTLNVTDGGGNWDIDTLIIVVNDTEKPIASASVVLQIRQGRFVSLDGNNSKDNLEIENYTWIIDDGGIKTLYGKLSSYRFKNTGKFSVTLKVTDTSGNWGSETKDIDVYPDTDKPVIGERFPKNNQKDVNVYVNPRIEFNDDIDPTTVEGNVYMGISGKDIEVDFDWELSNEGKELTLIPEKKLMENRIYTVALTEKIKDMAGNNLSAEKLEFSFGTEDSFKTLRFTIHPEIPKHGDTVNISIMFNKEIDQRTVTPNTLIVNGPVGEVPIIISFPGNKSRVVVTLVSQVESEERYILNVSGNIKDLGGSELGTSKEYSFTCSKSKTAENVDEPWNLFGLPINFIFLFVLVIAVIVFSVYVIMERKGISSGKDYENAVDQLKSRKRQMEQLRRIEGEERKKEEPRNNSKGVTEFSWKADDIKPRKREMPAGKGKVSYYHPQEISRFAGKTYDVAHPAKERPRRRPPPGRSSRERRHRDFHETHRRERTDRRRRGDDRRDSRRRPPPRRDGDVEWG